MSARNDYFDQFYVDDSRIAIVVATVLTHGRFHYGCKPLTGESWRFTVQNTSMWREVLLKEGIRFREGS